MYSYICFGKIRLQRYEIETKASRFTYCGIRKKNKKNGSLFQKNEIKFRRIVS